MINLTHLAAFHAVANAGSISGGAEKLLVSQPAISKQIRELERSTGAALFDRLPRGVRLTQAGELLAGYAARLFGIAAETHRAMCELQGLQRGRLSVAASPTIGVYLLPELFVQFRRKFPGVAMHLEIGNREFIGRRLVEGACDIGLTEVEAEAQDLEAEVFATDAMVAIAAPNHRLAVRSCTAAALCREPFVVRETGSLSKSLVETALAARGLTLTPVMSLGSTEAIKRAVAVGVGVAIVSKLSVSLELRLGTLAIIRVRDLALSRPLRSLRLRGHSDSKAAGALMDMLRNYVAKGL